MKTETIPFDLETAKKIQAGEIKGIIRTREGRTARFFGEIRDPVYPLVFAIKKGQYEDELLYTYTATGKYSAILDEDKDDIILEIENEHKELEQQFKPFDKVLVRDTEKQGWLPRLFDSHVEQADFWTQDGKSWKMCIPYEGNESLVNTTNKPKED